VESLSGNFLLALVLLLFVYSHATPIASENCIALRASASAFEVMRTEYRLPPNTTTVEFSTRTCRQTSSSVCLKEEFIARSNFETSRTWKQIIAAKERYE
jgi:hypothetical protein